MTAMAMSQALLGSWLVTLRTKKLVLGTEEALILPLI